MAKTRRNKASVHRRRSRKTRRLFVLKKGLLTKHGYHADLAEPERHQALQSALKEFSPVSLYRKLNAVYVLNKNRDKKRAQIFRSYANWLKTTPVYSNRKKV